MISGFITGLVLGISYYNNLENKIIKQKINGILYSVITLAIVALFTIFFNL